MNPQKNTCAGGTVRALFLECVSKGISLEVQASPEYRNGWAIGASWEDELIDEGEELISRLKAADKMALVRLLQCTCCPDARAIREEAMV